jgi:hypothetical protein
MKNIFYSLFFILSSLSVIAQNPDYTGVWNGKFYNNTGFGLQEDTYRFEVQIAQTGKGLEGVTYSYLSTTFYGKATHNGFIKSTGNKIVIQETKLVEVKSMSGGACLMTCTMKYSKEGQDEFLEGTFTAIDASSGGNCDGGYVKLKKVQKSIFGIDKNVKAKLNEIAKKKTLPPPVAPPKPSVVQNKKPVAKPTPKPPLVKKTTPKPPIVKKEAPKPPVVKNTPKPKKDTTSKPVVKVIPKEDTLKKVVIITPKAKDTIPVKPIVIVAPPPVIKERTNELVQTIPVADTNKYVIDFYDYGEVDGDIVTIFVNNKEVVSKQLLTTNPIRIPLQLSNNEPEVTVTMVAENLGTIPPNTAFMVVNIAGKRYEAKIESTEQKNAVIKFVYKPQ